MSINTNPAGINGIIGCHIGIDKKIYVWLVTQSTNRAIGSGASRRGRKISGQVIGKSKWLYVWTVCIIYLFSFRLFFKPSCLSSFRHNWRIRHHFSTEATLLLIPSTGTKADLSTKSHYNHTYTHTTPPHLPQQTCSNIGQQIRHIIGNLPTTFLC